MNICTIILLFVLTAFTSCYAQELIRKPISFPNGEIILAVSSDYSNGFIKKSNGETRFNYVGDETILVHIVGNNQIHAITKDFFYKNPAFINELIEQVQNALAQKGERVTNIHGLKRAGQLNVEYSGLVETISIKTTKAWWGFGPVSETLPINTIVNVDPNPCGVENSNSCVVGANSYVAYGSRGQFSAKFFQKNGTVSCSNSEFGDPIKGEQKYCYSTSLGNNRLLSPNQLHIYFYNQSNDISKISNGHKFIQIDSFDIDKILSNVNQKKIEEVKSRELSRSIIAKKNEILADAGKKLNELKQKEVSWSERITLVVAELLKSWLEDTGGIDTSEIPLPSYPATLSLAQDKWESNKEFEDRLAVTRAERQKEIDNIQNNYRQRVEQRNKNVAKINKIQFDKELELPRKRKEFMDLVISVDKPKITPKSAILDPERSILFIDAVIDNGGVERFEFKEASLEFRRNAITAISGIEFSPEVYVSEAGQFGIKGIKSGNTQGYPSQGGFTNQSLQIATVVIPTVVNALPLVKQTAITVDRNQVEQILYRDENESLRKRLEEQRQTQELALVESLRKASAETDRFKAEAEAARLKQRELEQKLAASPSTVNYGRTLNAHALIVGNSAYSGSAKLPNPINDAKAMSAKLSSLGFKVTEAVDADRIKLVTALSEFSQTAAGADVTLLFYAGHGVQISGTNYMLPVDLNMNDLHQVPLQGISLNDVVEKYLPGKTKLVFLDACRDNPLIPVSGRGVGRGLAPISVSEGTLIAYSTKDGQLAMDGVGKNSPFTEALLNHLDDQDDIAVVLRKVRDEVMRNTGNKQQPWEYGSLTGGALVLSAIKQK